MIADMLIKLTLKQEAELMAWVRQLTQIECNADCEPSGYYLEIGICNMSIDASAVKGPSRLDLGDVEVVLECDD